MNDIMGDHVVCASYKAYVMWQAHAAGSPRGREDTSDTSSLHSQDHSNFHERQRSFDIAHGRNARYHVIQSWSCLA